MSKYHVRFLHALAKRDFQYSLLLFHWFQHFQEEENYYCQDPTNSVKTGDTVLITQLPQKLTTLITHKVERVLFKCGDVIDPITKKPCVAWQYREDFDNIIDQYGRLPTSFDYSKAPPRGRLEGTRDLTDKPTYTKWTEDGSNDPYAY